MALEEAAASTILIERPLAFIGAYGAAIIGAMLAMVSIYVHLIHYFRPRLQRYIVRLLFFVPVYAGFSVLILLFPAQVVYFETLRNVWEAVVVYSFFSLILEYCGGENACALQISDDPGVLAHPWPFSWILRWSTSTNSSGGWRILNEIIPLDVYFIKFCKRCIILFTLVKPLMSIVTIVCHANGYDSSIVYIIIYELIYNISVFVALYALLLFYLATRHLTVLENRLPMLKFLSIKVIIVATWYQSVFLSLLFGFGTPLVSKWNNWLLCMELPLFAFLQTIAFPATEFIPYLLMKDGNQLPFYPSSDKDKTFLTSFSSQNETENPTSSTIKTESSSRLQISATAVGEAAKSVVPTRMREAAASSVGILFKGVSDIGNQEAQEKAFRNVKDAVSITDVVSDAIYNFSSKYNKHSLLMDNELDDIESFASAFSADSFQNEGDALQPSKSSHTFVSSSGNNLNENE
ncbi:hypothetical protein IE077_001913 [Cardiosporidium cionae]|uniref:Uncharacterized protein n=1 Tax=Cardiosporidium cionae TaxID=476202 RepID=A0ABQ7JBZ4_9APIC|nr:hypothetical protein IE077_001913 [Cardiosporidium cionae]|eukprot:KAF8821543.1 hypothetical protein IE077_001913 [Cardiosporidium cionae]